MGRIKLIPSFTKYVEDAINRDIVMGPDEIKNRVPHGYPIQKLENVLGIEIFEKIDDTPARVVARGSRVVTKEDCAGHFDDDEFDINIMPGAFQKELILQLLTVIGLLNSTRDDFIVVLNSTGLARFTGMAIPGDTLLVEATATSLSNRNDVVVLRGEGEVFKKDKDGNKIEIMTLSDVSGITMKREQLHELVKKEKALQS